MKKITLFIFVFLGFAIGLAQENYVVMVSLDGFRHDYIEKHNAKNLQLLAKKGVRVKRMVPSNPTKTFPNHYTLVTGLYPDNHGLVGNNFYDPNLQKEYSLRDRGSVEDGRFYGGEPIWNTAKKAGLKTASFFWVGSEAPINGMQPDIWKKYNGKISFELRIDSVISWLKSPVTERPRLVLLYFNEPDLTGHRYGPDSGETEKKVQYIDSLIGNLYKRLMQLPIAKQINLVLVADHGMRQLHKDKRVVLSDIVKSDWLLGVYGSNPVYTLRVKEGKQQEVFKSLKKNKHLHVFKKNQAPKRFNFAYHQRNNDLIVIAKRGYSLYVNHEKISDYGGAHGYLNSDRQMGALFVAIGNAFKQGYTKNCIKNIDVYNLLAHILHIEPAPNNGNFNRVKKLLKQ